MAESSNQQTTTRGISQPQRYFKIQMRAWTSFEASRMELGEIAERIERGLGFLTAIEVLKVAEDVTAIDDAEVRQSFENIIAAERTIRHLAELPKTLRERLYTALSNDPETVENTRAA